MDDRQQSRPLKKTSLYRLNIKDVVHVRRKNKNRRKKEIRAVLICLGRLLCAQNYCAPSLEVSIRCPISNGTSILQTVETEPYIDKNEKIVDPDKFKNNK